MPTLLSPKDLARQAVRIPVDDAEYDDFTQSRYGMTMDETIRIMATTQNRTQTFDSMGKPRDHDNDK